MMLGSFPGRKGASFRSLLAGAMAGVASALAFPAWSQEGIEIPAPRLDVASSPAKTETAIFAGGCFWGVQGIYQRVEGVQNAVSGYAGGDAASAVYEMVGTGRTGHAEAVAISYDPDKITYGKLLQIFFSVAHDPTQLDYQGPDVGPQYRSAIFPLNAEQAEVAKAYISQLDEAKLFDEPIVTTIEPDRQFYPAEDYHQDYLTLHPNQPYIVYNDLPKIENLKRLFSDLYRDDPVLVSEATTKG